MTFTVSSAVQHRDVPLQPLRAEYRRNGKRITVGVAIVAETASKTKKILLLQRVADPKKAYGNMCELPGGNSEDTDYYPSHSRARDEGRDWTCGHPHSSGVPWFRVLHGGRRTRSAVQFYRTSGIKSRRAASLDAGQPGTPGAPGLSMG
ncbi:hypothetical protein C8R44DRAFT_785174 [Mycena epipterygia]|nr:hypothetical protein C8R44DRAFT_785174 [Mycena epipterygia]